MTDREKVLYELKHQVADADWCDNDWKDNVPIWMLRGALALLKEKEAVEPVKEHEVVMNTLACGACHTLVARWGNTWEGDRVYLFKAKYCPECGRKVKWDG